MNGNKWNNSADKVSAEGGRGSAVGAAAEIPLQPVVKALVRQPKEVHNGAEIYFQPMKTPRAMLGQAPGSTCGPLERVIL